MRLLHAWNDDDVCGLPRENPTADEDDIRDAISGNICRCTGYETIVDAALEAAVSFRGKLMGVRYFGARFAGSKIPSLSPARAAIWTI